MTDDERFAALGRALADAVVAAVPGWVRRAVAERAGAAGVAVDPAEVARAERAVVDEIEASLRALLAADVDAQRQNPLALVRAAVGHPTAVLRRAGVPFVERDETQEGLFPDDVYDLVPATFADLGPEVGEAGIAWGAAKAYVHRRRHQP